MIKATLLDVAKYAGVSVATVDRVLNKRSGVRKQTIVKVRNAIAALGYERDILAARLSRATWHRIAFIVPRYPSMFSCLVQEDLSSMTNVLGLERTLVDIHHYDLEDAGHQENVVRNLSKEYDAIAFSGLNTPGIAAALLERVESGKLVITFMTDVPESGRKRAILYDNYAAGRTGAHLLSMLTKGEAGKLIVFSGLPKLWAHAERWRGFQDYIREFDCPFDLLDSVIEFGNLAEGEFQAARYLNSNEPFLGMYNVGAGTPAMMEALVSTGAKRKIHCVGHALTPHFARGINLGRVDVVIAQDPGYCARTALDYLLAELDEREVDEARIGRLNLDLYTSENRPAWLTEAYLKKSNIPKPDVVRIT